MKPDPATANRRTSACVAATLALSVAAGCAVANRMSGVTEARAIQRVGVAAEAVILQVWDTGITYNEDPVVGLRVEVRMRGSEPYTATIAKSRISRIDVPQFQPGKRVPVRVDPNDRTRVAIDVYK